MRDDSKNGSVICLFPYQEIISHWRLFWTEQIQPKNANTVTLLPLIFQLIDHISFRITVCSNPNSRYLQSNFRTFR